MDYLNELLMKINDIAKCIKYEPFLRFDDRLYRLFTDHVRQLHYMLLGFNISHEKAYCLVKEKPMTNKLPFIEEMEIWTYCLELTDERDPHVLTSMVGTLNQLAYDLAQAKKAGILITGSHIMIQYQQLKENLQYVLAGYNLAAEFPYFLRKQECLTADQIFTHDSLYTYRIGY